MWGATNVGTFTPLITGHFNPRSPCGERHQQQCRQKRRQRFQSTLPVWGATGPSTHRLSPPLKISIHAPRVGSDLMLCRRHTVMCLFQSTLPVWGATARTCKLTRQTLHFNPRSPCGERRRNQALKTCRGQISIHAPRVGSDFASCSCNPDVLHFNPRSPCGERQTFFFFWFFW